MFYTLLSVSLLLSFIVCLCVVLWLRKPIDRIFQRIIKDPVSYAWSKFVHLATYSIGVGSGVNTYRLEQYLPNRDGEIQNFNTARWALEVYKTIINTLQAISWLYLLTFVFTLLSYAIVRSNEIKQGHNSPNS